MAITIVDIAKRAGVSIATVSRFINKKQLHKVGPETQKRLNVIIEELKYAPSYTAVNLAKRSLKTLGLLIKYRIAFNFGYYFNELVRGALTKCEEEGYKLLLLPLDFGKKDELKRVIRSKMVQGLLLLGTEIDDPIIAELQQEKTPFVVLNNYSEQNKYNYVDSDNIRGAEEVVNYLIQKGHTKIAFIGGPENSRNARDRFQGYKNALENHAIIRDEDLYYEGKFFEADGLQAVDKFMNKNKPPSAIFSADDTMALGVIRALKKYHLNVPNDVAVVGFDNSFISEFVDPPLTTVQDPIYDIGNTAAHMLLKIVEGDKTESSVILKTRLIVRESA